MVEEVLHVDPAEARKRRKAIISTQRHNEEASSTAPTPVADATQTGTSTTSTTSINVGTAVRTAVEGTTAAQPPPSDPLFDTSDNEDEGGEDDNDDGCSAGQGSVGGDDSMDHPTTGGGASQQQRRKIEVRGNKRRGTQVRYDPEVPMSKEQLAMWRRECRRVRNRESAAASRARVRGRIQELEVEVEDWKTKYAHAMQRLENLRQIQRDNQAVPTANDSMKAAL